MFKVILVNDFDIYIFPATYHIFIDHKYDLLNAIFLKKTFFAKLYLDVFMTKYTVKYHFKFLSIVTVKFKKLSTIQLLNISILTDVDIQWHVKHY